MTVLRREDVQSRVASWDRCPYRIVSSPILAIVPLIIRRLRGPSPNRIMRLHRVSVVARRYFADAGAGCSAAHRKPASSRAIATAIFGAGLCSAASFRKRRHSRCCALSAIAITRAWLSLAPPRQRDADARAMLIVPRRFHQQPPDQRVPGARDAAAPMLLAARVLARHQPEIRHQRRRRREPPKVMQLREDQHRRQRIDAAETPQPADRLAIRLALGDLRQPRVQFAAAAPRCDRSPTDSRRRRPARPRASTSDCRSTGDARASSCVPRSAGRAAAATCPSRCRHRCRSSRASSRARAKSRTASSSGVGGCTAVSNPARPSSTSLRASRRFVFTRSPGLRGISAGATTSQLTRDVVTCRCNA